MIKDNNGNHDRSDIEALFDRFYITPKSGDVLSIEDLSKLREIMRHIPTVDEFMKSKEMITLNEVEQIMEDKNITFLPPDDEIKKWADENYGMAYTIALTIVYQFIAFVQEWNNKDLSIPNEHDTIDKPLDTVSSCCHADYQVGGDEGTYYYVCHECGNPCDAIPASEKV